MAGHYFLTQNFSMTSSDVIPSFTEEMVVTSSLNEIESLCYSKFLAKSLPRAAAEKERYECYKYLCRKKAKDFLPMYKFFGKKG